MAWFVSPKRVVAGFFPKKLSRNSCQACRICLLYISVFSWIFPLTKKIDLLTWIKLNQWILLDLVMNNYEKYILTYSLFNMWPWQVLIIFFGSLMYYLVHTISNNCCVLKGSFSCKRGFSLLNFERGLKKTMGCLILKLYVVIIRY